MKRTVFIDTNIALDFICSRAPFYRYSAELFSLAEKKKIIIYISAFSIVAIHYILLKQSGKETAGNILRQFRALIKILPIDEQIIDLSIASNFTDFEDAIQYNCAISANISVFITRDIKDYTNAKIPVMSAENFLKKYKKNN